ncbi:hypothetical protein NDS46_30580 (plasmid) [Paenibacillus thiaminolyticus]|uniref:hypothetical protein n=1 Tax=Paenibacillus thiaminolyticus TaxID=49283 RepID=UPI00232F8C6A|nr:hypothetical protein [Paenibacillus thiaminolyticus]WCF11696.1 hypothetical protein NDS46_30580 [Paenibacillus thiaminolyticus]
MTNQLVVLLRELSFYSVPIEEKRLINHVLRLCKNKRNLLNAEEILANGYNIFERRNVSIQSVIEAGVEAGYVIPSKKDADENMVLISDAGQLFLFNLYTNNNSDDFRSYKEKADQMMLEQDELPLNPNHIASSFWIGKTVGDLCLSYLDPDSYSYHKESEMYHQHMMSLMGCCPKDTDFIFHFAPKLFLPRNMMHEKVTLKIDGIQAPELYISRPYPNKRYHTAGIKENGMKTSSGFYPIIAPKERFPECLNIKLTWTIGNFVIKHEMNIRFKFADHPGRLFSSEQYLSRSNTLAQLNLRTFLEKDTDCYFWRSAPRFSQPRMFFGNSLLKKMLY